ncbi:growth hormone secretagogue receptor type 1-like [Littorina saxatilis]|uniref:growth hormone secretagogue receptor type 1-like n=1 Tax=Littorina saxatilis TaxID=31220 RepID=UPI0038B4D722
MAEVNGLAFNNSLGAGSSPNTEEPPENSSLSAPRSPPPELSAVLVADLWLWRLYPPLLLILGTFGNCATIATLRRLRSGWSSISVYLTALALTDTSLLYSGLLTLWLRQSFGVNIFSRHIVACKLFPWLNNSLGTLSAWLVVCLTLQRAASVIWPHRVSVICTRHRSYVVIGVVSVIIGLLYSHMIYGYDLQLVGQGPSRICDLRSAEYSQFWGDIWARVDLFIYSIVPSVVIVGGNGALVWKLAASTRRATQKLSAGQSLQNDDRAKKTSSATITVIVVSLTFVCFSVPLTIYVNSVFSKISDRGETSPFQYLVYNSLMLLYLSNFAVNFYLYCLTGSRFREAFFSMLPCWANGTTNVKRAATTKGTSIYSVSASEQNHNT